MNNKERTYEDNCKFRYDEYRKGDTKKGSGEHTLQQRCILIKHGNRKCIFVDKTHKDCPISTTKKHKIDPSRVKFKGKWKKRRES